MRDFNRGRSSGGRDFKRRDFNGSQVMHKTICSDCGKECEVPFKPNGSKPVFCRDCFQGKRSSDSTRSENFPPRRSFEDNRPQPVLVPQYGQQFEALNAKLDKILNLLAVKEVAVSKPIQVAKMEIPEVEAPVVKKRRVLKKKV